MLGRRRNHECVLLENGSRRQMRMARKGGQEAVLAKLLPLRLRCFGDSMCVD